MNNQKYYGNIWNDTTAKDGLLTNSVEMVKLPIKQKECKYTVKQLVFLDAEKVKNELYYKRLYVDALRADHPSKKSNAVVTFAQKLNIINKKLDKWQNK